MGNKKLIVNGLGLVILIIAVGIAYQNYVYAVQARNQVVTLNATIQQKDMKIMELTKEIAAKQDELSSVRAELENIKKVVEDAKAQIDKAANQPNIKVP